MKAFLKQGLIAVGNTVQEAVKLWHIMVGALVFAAAIIGWTAGYVQPASAADLTHKELKIETDQIREDMAKIQHQAATNMAQIRSMLELKIQQDNLKDVNRDLKNNDAEQYAIQQWVKVNGETPTDTKRLRDLKNERDMLEIKRSCIIANNRACKD